MFSTASQFKKSNASSTRSPDHPIPQKAACYTPSTPPPLHQMCNQHLHLLPHPIRDLIRLHTRLCVLQRLRRLRSTRCLLVIRIHVIVLTHVAVHIPLITTITTISTITTITSGAFLPWHPKGFFFHQTPSRPVAPRGVPCFINFISGM